MSGDKSVPCQIRPVLTNLVTIVNESRLAGSESQGQEQGAFALS